MSRRNSPIPLLVIGDVSGLAWLQDCEALWLRSPDPIYRSPGPGRSVGYCCRVSAWGVLLAYGEYVRRMGGRRGWRCRPLLFSGVLLTGLGDVGSMFERGIGGGTIGVPLIGMLGGYALSGRGPLRGRIVSGVIAMAAIPIWGLTVTSFGGPGLALTTPRGAWVAIYFYSFLAVLSLGCAIPHRHVVGRSAS